MIKIHRKTFQSRLTTLAKCAANRGTMPILCCVHLSVKGGQVMMQSTNMEVVARTAIAVAGDDEFTIVAPVRSLQKYVSKSRADAIGIEYDADKNRLGIHTEHGKFQIGIKHKVYDFPDIPYEFEPFGKANIDFAPLILAASDDESHPTFTCVSMQLSKDHIHLAATDGYRLSMLDVDCVCNRASDDVLLPATALRKINNRLNGGWQFGGDAQTFHIVTEHWHFTIERPDNRFPPYMGIVPEKPNRAAKKIRGFAIADDVDAGELLAAFENAEMVASWNNRMCHMTLNGAVSIQSDGRGEDDEEMFFHHDVEGNMGGEEATISLNTRYMIEFLKVARLRNRTVNIEVTQPTRPVMLRSGDDFRCVVMPMYPPR